MIAPLKSSRRERQSPRFPGERPGKRGRVNRARAARELSDGPAKPARMHGRHPVTYSEKRASRESIRRRRLAGLCTRAALRRTKKQGRPITAAEPQRAPLGRLSFRSRSITTTVVAVAEKETNTRGRAGKPLEHTGQGGYCRPARRARHARRVEKEKRKEKDEKKFRVAKA